jgi:phytoene/squalene synthetase
LNNLPRALLGISAPQSDQHRAERFNRDMAKREAGNFYWGFISLGYHERMAIYALYNFAGQVDDEADCGGTENLPARLSVHRERISRAMRGEYGDDPILRVLSEAVERYSIPEKELQMLIDGVEMDFSRAHYERSCAIIAIWSLRWSAACAFGSSASPIRSRSIAPTISALRCS